jgi:hypothetical protein
MDIFPFLYQHLQLSRARGDHVNLNLILKFNYFAVFFKYCQRLSLFRRQWAASPNGRATFRANLFPDLIQRGCPDRRPPWGRAGDWGGKILK